ncbi:MAG: LysR family transcriptional regulator [Blautia marasmi]
MYISQPSLSATIKKIETRLGTPIFDRSTSPIQLTECGENTYITRNILWIWKMNLRIT